jgi:hypothetical protein
MHAQQDVIPKRYNLAHREIAFLFSLPYHFLGKTTEDEQPPKIFILKSEAKQYPIILFLSYLKSLWFSVSNR